jgi:threonine/homoserine/homoserine lactone efflux protein
VGAAYLVYLGVKTLLTREKNIEAEAKTIQEKGLSRAFTQAVLVNVLNPKSAMFFVVNAVLLRPLSYNDPDRLARQ